MASITDLADLFGSSPPPVDLATMFTTEVVTWLNETYPSLQKERSPGLHASSLWKTCARQHTLLGMHKGKTTKEVLGAGNFLTFDVGHALHHWWQNNYLGPMGLIIGDWYCSRCNKNVHNGTQPKVCPKCFGDRSVVLTYAESIVRDDKLGYVGHCDGVLVLAGRKVIFEFKTASPTEYEKLTQPKIQHIVQAHAYMNGLKVRETLVVYQNKGRQCGWTKNEEGWKAGRPEIKVFHLKFDDDYWTTYVKRCADYGRAVDLVRNLPVVTATEVAKFERICVHKNSLLAEECPVVNECFA